MNSTRQTLGEYLLELRNSEGITQEAVAKQIKVVVSTISRWEANVNLPKIHMLKQVVVYLRGDTNKAQKLFEDAQSSSSKLGKPGNPGYDSYYEFLANSRGDLRDFIISHGYYRDEIEKTVASFPLITKPEWLPTSIFPIREIKLELVERTDNFVQPKFTAKYPRFSQYKLSKGERISSSQIYRLVKIQVIDEVPKLSCDFTHYDRAIDVQELIAFETAKWYIKNNRLKPNNDGSDLVVRGPAPNIWKLRKREAAWSTNTITIILDHPSWGNVFFLHDRNSPQLAEAKNITSIVPAGTFQPNGISDWEEDFSLEKNIIREFLEELMGREEYQQMTTSGDDFVHQTDVKNIWEALQCGDIKLQYLGIGFDPVSTKPGLLSALILKWQNVEHFLNKGFVDNWEGNYRRCCFDKESLRHAATRDHKMLPFGAACCYQALTHFDEIIA